MSERATTAAFTRSRTSGWSSSSSRSGSDARSTSGGALPSAQPHHNHAVHRADHRGVLGQERRRDPADAADTDGGALLPGAQVERDEPAGGSVTASTVSPAITRDPATDGGACQSRRIAPVARSRRDAVQTGQDGDDAARCLSPDVRGRTAVGGAAGPPSGRPMPPSRPCRSTYTSLASPAATSRPGAAGAGPSNRGRRPARSPPASRQVRTTRPGAHRPARGSSRCRPTPLTSPRRSRPPALHVERSPQVVVEPAQHVRQP